MYGITVPDPPRKDLLPLVTYTGPTIPASTKAGPVADLLRLNTAILPSNPGCATTHRMGVLGGDLCGFPNGRRLIDDVTDIARELWLAPSAARRSTYPRLARPPRTALAQRLAPQCRRRRISRAHPFRCSAMAST